MPSFWTRLADGWERALDHLPLALVPLVLALVQTDKIGSVLAFDGVHIGLRLGIPASVVTVWQFVDPPSSGVTVTTGLPLSHPFAATLVPAIVALEAALHAGYFGAIAAALVDRDRSFAASAGAYFGPFLVITALPYLVVVPVALGVFGLGSLDGGAVVAVLVLLPVWLVASYLLWATPYLVVLRETGLVAAARGSYELAVDGGPYFAYTAGYAGFVLLVSPFVSVVVVSVPLVGLLVGLAGGSVLGLALNFVTMGFVADIDPESPSVGPWTEERGDSVGSPTPDER
ncbi:hypothetical protein [Haloarcula salina]|uniref:Uncharacterized protein n=1 Tax=Haloarcula salina TaxID=1429914 RepID=A0AA41G280_9EURY|nr:hypothetical protein [Haloarcula salina]MBV0902116.1 hypothetical protein [Haloarcula salina]